MFLFKCIYRRKDDPTEYDCNVIGSSPEEIQRFFISLYGELPYFSMQSKIPIHHIMQDIEERIFIKKQKEDNACKT